MKWKRREKNEQCSSNTFISFLAVKFLFRHSCFYKVAPLACKWSSRGHRTVLNRSLASDWTFLRKKKTHGQWRFKIHLQYVYSPAWSHTFVCCFEKLGHQHSAYIETIFNWLAVAHGRRWLIDSPNTKNVFNVYLLFHLHEFNLFNVNTVESVFWLSVHA